MISFIMPTYGRGDLIDFAINHINKYCTLDKEIIVIDDAFGLILNKLNTTVINNKTNLGFAKSCNKGANKAKGELLCFINSDVFIYPKCIEKMVEDLQFADIIGARLEYPNGNIQHAGQAYMGNFQFNHHTSEQPSRFVPVTGALLVISKQTFIALNGFDENFFIAYEDVDLCFRAIMCNYKIYYDKEAKAIHYEGATRGNSIESKTKLNLRAFELEHDSLKYFKTLYSEEDCINLINHRGLNDKN